MNKKVLTALTVAGVATAAMATDVSADTYTVKSGDTLSSIAADHNTTVDRILNVNKIADSNMIFVGEQFELDDQAANAQTQAVAPASSAATTQQSVATSVAPAASQAPSLRQHQVLRQQQRHQQLLIQVQQAQLQAQLMTNLLLLVEHQNCGNQL